MIGEALRVARRAQGITQEQLAQRSGVRQAALSRYENDLRSPNPEVLSQLAAALGVTPKLLLSSQQVAGAMAIDVHMRRRSTAPVTAWRHLEARLNMYRLHTSHLMDEVALRAERAIPLIDPFEADPETAARVVRMQWRVPTGPVRDLTRWMESAGCLIIEEEFGTSRIDGLSQWIGDYPVVLVNSRVPIDRKRLTLAHELAHLVMHSESMTAEPEAEANRFAAEFLMPAEIIRPELRGNLTLGRLRDLKLTWMVSMQALIERAWHLKVISGPARAKLYKQLGSRGWRRLEPESDRLPPEHPRLVRDIGAALAARGLTQDEIARVAGFSEASDLNPFQPQDGRHLRAL